MTSEGFELAHVFMGKIEQLGITLIKARSAQAKGRVERLLETL